MKLSVTPDHPGFDPEAHMLAIKVKLDDVLIRNVIALDTDAGYVITLGKPNDFSNPRETQTFGKVTVLDFETDKVLHETPNKEPA